MAFMAGLVLATLGFVGSVFLGLVLLIAPKTRQLAAYAFLMYPLAYLGGLLSFFAIGVLANNIDLLQARNTDPRLSFAITVALAVTVFGAGALGAIAGAVAGMVWANRIWWRLFSTTADEIKYPPPRWLAMPPLVRRLWARIFNSLRAAWKELKSAPQNP